MLKHNEETFHNGHAPYAFMHAPLTHHFETDADMVWTAQKLTVINVCLGWLATLLNIDEGNRFKTKIPATSRRFVFTGAGCGSQQATTTCHLGPAAREAIS